MVEPIEPTPAPAPPPTETTGPAIPVPGVTAHQITPERPGDIRYRDRRLMAMYFDMSAMPVPDQVRAEAAALKFIQTQMKPADLMAIMALEPDPLPGDFVLTWLHQHYAIPVLWSLCASGALTLLYFLYRR